MANINIKFKVKDEDVDEFLIGFLAEKPVPLDDEQQPLYDDETWVEICTQQFLIKTYKRGKIRLSKEEAEIEDIEMEDIT